MDDILFVLGLLIAIFAVVGIIYIPISMVVDRLNPRPTIHDLLRVDGIFTPEDCKQELAFVKDILKSNNLKYKSKASVKSIDADDYQGYTKVKAVEEYYENPEQKS